MPETARSKPLEIWFQDEARVGQQGTLTRIWAERGTRPRAPRDTRYIWSYIFGAVCPERAEAAALIMPHADTQAMSAHLHIPGYPPTYSDNIRPFVPGYPPSFDALP